MLLSALAVAGVAFGQATDICQTGCPYDNLADAIAFGYNDLTITDLGVYDGVTLGAGTWQIDAGGATIERPLGNLAAIESFGGDVEVSNAVIDPLSATGIYASGGTLTVTNVTIAGGLALWGGAISGTNADITVLDSVMTVNRASVAGGAIYVNGGGLEVTNTLFDQNSSQAAGGGISVQNVGDVVLTDVIITRSSARDDGGAIDVSNSTSLTIDGVSTISDSEATSGAGIHAAFVALVDIGGQVLFSGNRALGKTLESGSGGAIKVSESPLTVQPGASFAGNTASIGGAIYAFNTTVDLDQAVFDGNWVVDDRPFAVGLGGSMTIDFATLTTNQCQFDDGTADGSSGGYGGHLSLFGSSWTDTGSSFALGMADLGGAVSADPLYYGYDVTLTDTRFENNTGHQSGGALSVFGANAVTLTRPWLRRNDTSSGHGGAMEVLVSQTVVIDDGRFEDNDAGGGGGDLFLFQVPGSSTITSTSFVRGQAQYGGSIYASYLEGPLLVEGSLFEGPIAWPTLPFDGGGAILAEGAGSLEVADTTFDGPRANLGGTGGALHAVGLDVVTITHSLFLDPIATQSSVLEVQATPDVSFLRNRVCGNGGDVTQSAGVLHIEDSCGVGCLMASNRITNVDALDGSVLTVDRSDVRMEHETWRHIGGPGAAAVVKVGSLDASWSLIDDVDGDVFFDSTLKGGAISVTRSNLSNVAGVLVPTDASTTDLTSSDPQWLTGDATPSRCDVEFRIHPDSPFAQVEETPGNPVDLGALDGPNHLAEWRTRDNDGDTTAWVYDCREIDPRIHAFADERCNGFDDDCDGLVDHADDFAATRRYPDADGDGWGATDGWDVCLGEAVEPGTADRGGDCDDDVAVVNPGATEVCNKVDDDCNGLVDDDAIDGTTYLWDLDGDGHGSAIGGVTTCDRPDGMLAAEDARGEDCDDENAEVHPGATEVADDGIDNNCDGFEGQSFLAGQGCGCSQGRPGGAGLLLALGLAMGLRRRSATD